MAKLIRFTSYSKAKFAFLHAHGVMFDESMVRQAILEPERVTRTRFGRWIAQRPISERHLIRVV